MIRERHCRNCGSALETILYLGDLHPSNFLKPGENPLPPVPFDLCACQSCRLVQLRHTVEADLMFRKYWYLSGINETMKAELASIVEQAKQFVPLAPGDVVVDIGANDGTLLQNYSRMYDRVAFEPARNLNDKLRDHADYVVADYFPRGLKEIPELAGRKAKIVTSIACFYDLDDPHAFIDGIEAILHYDGLWVLQFQDWDQMQKATAFDNICMEHLCYYSLRSFELLLAQHRLEVVHAEPRPINGGSYRILVQHKGRREIRPTVMALRKREVECEAWDTFQTFAHRVREAKRQILGVLDHAKVIDLYGASTKANTLLQYCGLNTQIIRQAWERSPDKVGLRTIGTDIPIVDEAIGRDAPPDVLLAGIWQFRDAILSREHAYLATGRPIIFPLPAVEIVMEGREAQRA